jgi:putative ABC transport system ATP-binding protein
MTKDTLIVEIRDLGVQLGTEFSVYIERLDVAAGEVVVLDAQSGAGKSTVLGLIAGAIVPTNLCSGSHRLSGLQITTDLRRSDYARAGKIGFVLQTSVLIPYLTLDQNIKLPLRIHGQNPDPQWAEYVTGALGLSPLLLRRPNQVSVGQRQRAALARALMGKPDLLLLDEPVSALDPENAAQVEALIQILSQDAGSAVVLASHQALRGAFAKSRRVSHRLETRSGINHSLFSDAPGPNSAGACV